MKKTNSMRVAVAILALTLITSCFVGGTFARYTTKGTASDTARYAEFGVELAVNKSVFKTEYSTTDNEITGGFSVKSKDDTKVVAPGTDGNFDLFTIDGKPEVAVEVSVTLKNVDDVFKMITLPANTEGTSYKDYTDISEDKTFTIDKDYNPIKWTLTVDEKEIADLKDVTLETINTYLEQTVSGKYAPNSKEFEGICGKYNLSWTWEFSEATDREDTYLGNAVADKISSLPAGVITDEAFSFSISVTQID